MSFVVAARRSSGIEAALWTRLLTAFIVELFCCRSHRRFWRRDDVSSVRSMLRRVVRGDSAGGWTLEVVMMIGFARVPCARIIRPASSWGEVPVEGPLGLVVRDLRIAGLDRDAAFWRAVARSVWCSAVVRRERCEVRFGLESTLLNSSFSLTLGGPLLLSSSSSQSSSSVSSSSMALSSESSSSVSLAMASSLSEAMVWKVRMATSCLNDVVFRMGAGCLNWSVRELRLVRYEASNELMLSSSDEAPRVNMGFFLPAGWALEGSGRGKAGVLRMGVGFRLVLERIDVEMRPGVKPWTTLCVLMSVEVLISEPTSGLVACVATVDEDESGTQRVGGGVEGRGVVSAEGFVCWMTVSCGRASCSGSGESGSMRRFSCIELTTFSRSMGVMCLPRAWLFTESWRCRHGRDIEAVDRVVAVRALSGLESSEATLDDSSGSSWSLLDRRRSKDQRGGKMWSGAQQKVSLDQSRQAC